MRSVHAVCHSCGRLNKRRSRRGLYWSCKHCKALNIGPALLEAVSKPPDAQRRRRIVRRERDQERPEASTSPAAPAAAPVRRKRSAPAPKPAAEATPAPAAAEASPPPSRRGLLDALDTLLYGGG